MPDAVSADDIDGLMELYEEAAIYPGHHGTANGAEQTRPVVQSYIDPGATLEFER